MIPVDQSISDANVGDCMRATVASLLELPLDAVPHFLRFDDNKWWDILYWFLWANGYEYIGVMNYSATEENDLREDESFNGYFWACVPSRNFEGQWHAVVMDMNGVIAHDPSPTKKWQGINVIDTGELIYWYRMKQRA